MLAQDSQKKIMKKNNHFFLLFFLIVFNLCGAQNAKKIFREKLSVVENYHKGKKTFITELKKSAIFLTELTEIQFEIYDSYEMSEVTSKQNLKDWKIWYKKNKNNLYWDKIEQKVKVKHNR